MQRNNLSAMLGATLLLCGAPVWAQPAAGIGGEWQQDFEDNQTGWIAFGKNAQVGMTREPENVHEGQAALQFDYDLQADNITALAFPDARGLAHLKQLSFWVKTAQATPLVFIVQEQNGGRWGALFWLPADKWQHVVLEPRDFSLWPEFGSAPDEDGTLDFDNLEWAGLADFSQLFLRMPQLQALFPTETGSRTLWLDEFQKTNAVEPNAPHPAHDEAVPQTLVIDDFQHPQLGWMPLGTTQIEREEMDDNAAKLPVMRVSYAQKQGQFGGVVRRMAVKSLEGAKKLTLHIASQNAAILAVQVEETGGGKYYAPLTIVGDGKLHNFDLQLADFLPSEDSKDANQQLDMNQVHQIVLLDTAFLNPAADGQNSLWLGEIKADK